jgi:hypothetical protein
VTLTIDSSEVATLPPPDGAAASFRPNLRAGRIGKLFGGGWRRG